jgi:sugar/nucleoside kinase (ribokinase family)
LRFSDVSILDLNFEKVLQVMEHSTYVFGNEKEWKAFANTQGMPIESSWVDIGKEIVEYKYLGEG